MSFLIYRIIQKFANTNEANAMSRAFRYALMVGLFMTLFCIVVLIDPFIHSQKVIGISLSNLLFWVMAISVSVSIYLIYFKRKDIHNYQERYSKSWMDKYLRNWILFIVPIFILLLTGTLRVVLWGGKMFGVVYQGWF